MTKIIVVVDVVKRPAAPEQGVHRLPRTTGCEARRVHAEVKVAPDHESRHRAAKGNYAAGTAEDLDQPYLMHDYFCLPLERSLACQ
jgi:hypothetical protein